jgi:hypothetical protein
MIPTTVRRMTAIHLLPCVITRADGGSLAATGISTNARVRSAAKLSYRSVSARHTGARPLAGALRFSGLSCRVHLVGGVEVPAAFWHLGEDSMFEAKVAARVDMMKLCQFDDRS